MTSPAPIFDHLQRLTDARGTATQARLSEPVRNDGYRTDDMARLLVIATREPDATGEVNRLARIAIQFLNDAQSFAGKCRNLMDRNGNWTDEPATEDTWGRCLWALGTAAAHSDVGLIRRLAIIQFDRSAKVRSTSPRAMAFAALGAAELLSVEPDHQAARALLTDFASGSAQAGSDAGWPWPESRLADANAVLPEAMIAAGAALGDAALQQRGLDLLAWLIGYETVDGHFSPTPECGRGSDDPRPGFDQQPNQISSIADACARAARTDTATIWPDSVRAAAAWFGGDNDAGLPMWDPLTGGGFDGLHAGSVDPNQGAESTLAVLSTLQQAQRLSTVPQ